jgi:hypothetical protein
MSQGSIEGQGKGMLPPNELCSGSVMIVFRSVAFFCAAVFFLFSQSACFFSGGVSTMKKQTNASGSGFLSATERSGQWDADGPPPRVGEVTSRPIYRKMEKSAAFSIAYLGRSYELSDPYPARRSRIAAIREIGTDSDNSGTVHYYEVEFDPESSG